MGVFGDFDTWYRDLGGSARSSDTRMKAMLAGAYRAGARRGAVAARGGSYPDGFCLEVETLLRGEVKS